MSEEKKSSGLNGDPVGSEVRESLWSLISLMKSNVYLCLGSAVRACLWSLSWNFERISLRKLGLFVLIFSQTRVELCF